MGYERRWDPCIVHCGDEADRFIEQYFAQTDRNILLVAGAGFDPRSCIVSMRLSKVSTNLRALFIRENRPHPQRNLLDLAEENIKTLLGVLVNSPVEPVEIFGSDNAVIGGRNVIAVLRQQSLKDVTDVIVDASALSAGISFPIIRDFLVRPGQRAENLHLFVVHAPHIDAGIRSVDSDAPNYVHGFRGRFTPSDTDDMARLWLPQLAAGRRAALERLHSFIEPHDTCLVLPFPATNPRIGDALVEEYLMNDEPPWLIDARNIVYADEGDPLDLYRTILTLDDRRKPVFAETGGSRLVLSPLGSKVMALGALMAALERDLPVAYLESIGYELESSVPKEIDEPSLIHLWLEGDVYPPPCPALPTEGGVT